ncbi:putative transposase YbfD/YdcC [Klebsiella sp. BIGb0407]|nr:putative transposase YbfD/YdcC [Klebsiella sp. BIGb0407]
MAGYFSAEIINDDKEPKRSLHYYINSSNIFAERFTLAMRGYRAVETRLHWYLDAGMSEDNC